MSMYLVIMEGTYCAIDTDYSSCHGYYIIKFYSYPYTLQSDLIIDRQVISSSRIVFEGTYFFPININSHYYVLQKNKSIGNVNIICYYSKDGVPLCLSSIPQNYYNTLSPLHNLTKEHDIIMDGNNQIEGIEFERYVSILTQDATYYYNDECWDSI